MKQIFKQKPLACIGGGIVLIQIALAAPAINASLEQQEALSTIAETARKEQAQMMINDKARRERSEIARARYQSGCLNVINRDNDDNPIAIREGDIVFDYYNDVPIAQGLIVCDRFGVTGVVGPDHKVTEIAVLLDLSQIPDAIEQVDVGGN